MKTRVFFKYLIRGCNSNLNVYGLSLSVSKLMHDNLLNRKQRTKNGFSYSYWEGIFAVVPQGFILGSLLFNIFSCDMFWNLWITFLQILKTI